MIPLDSVKLQVQQRLHAAAEEIFELVERFIREYKEDETQQHTMLHDQCVESSLQVKMTSPVSPEHHAGWTKRQRRFPQHFQDFELASIRAIGGATDHPHEDLAPLSPPAQYALTSVSINSFSEQCEESPQARTPDPVKKEEPEDHPDFIVVKEEAEDPERCEANTMDHDCRFPPYASIEAIGGATDHPHPLEDLAPPSPPGQYALTYTVSNNSSSESDREEEEEEEGEEEGQKQRRHADINEDDLDELERSRPHTFSTFRQTQWSVRCFQTWCAEKELAVDFATVTKVELNQTLRRFYASVRNGKGKPYGFSSYVGLRAGLNRHLNDPPVSRAMCLLKDPEFSSSNAIYVTVLKRLRREGLRNNELHHRGLTEADFEKIARSPALDPNTPEGLVNKVWFDVQLHMGRLAREGNRHLKAQAFSVLRDAAVNGGRKYVTLALDEYPKAPRDGGERDRRRLRGFMCEQPGNPLCPVASLEKYLSLLPEDPPAFYLHPLRSTNISRHLWYSREPMGINFLASMLPRICKAAGTETIYTNICLQKTPVPKPFDAASLIPNPSIAASLVVVPIPFDAANLVPNTSNAGSLEARETIPVSTGHTTCESSLSSCSRHNHPKDSSRWRNILPKAPLKRTTSATESNPAVPEKKKSSANRDQRLLREAGDNGTSIDQARHHLARTSTRKAAAAEVVLTVCADSEQLAVTFRDLFSLSLRQGEDVLHRPVCKAEVSPEHQQRSSSPILEEIKDQEILHRRRGSGVSTRTLRSLQSGRNERETAPLASTSTEHMKTRADRVEYGGTSRPTADDVQLLSSESDPEDSDDEWEQTREDQPALNTLQSHQTQAVDGQFFSWSDDKLSQEDPASSSSEQAPSAETHAGRKIFSCTICGKQFNRKGNLNMHAMTHTGEKPFSCPVCGKGFSRMSSLRLHWRIHTGDKPFSCTICSDKHFLQKAHLQMHMRTHTGERPFACSVCGKAFGQRGDLSKHMKIHTREKPFSCTICSDKHFTQKAHLQLHMRTHAGGNTL